MHAKSFILHLYNDSNICLFFQSLLPFPLLNITSYLNYLIKSITHFASSLANLQSILYIAVNLITFLSLGLYHFSMQKTKKTQKNAKKQQKQNLPFCLESFF